MWLQQKLQFLDRLLSFPLLPFQFDLGHRDGKNTVLAFFCTLIVDTRIFFSISTTNLSSGTCRTYNLQTFSFTILLSGWERLWSGEEPGGTAQFHHPSLTSEHHMISYTSLIDSGRTNEFITYFLSHCCLL